MLLRIACTGLLLTFAASGTSAPPQDVGDLAPYTAPQRLVKLPSGRRMNIHCTGQGAATVLLEGGWTTTTLWWRNIQARIAAKTRVCSYDRAGYGFSDPGPMPRTAEAIAADLDALLKAAGERCPFILVAHSLGGLDARIFADRHPLTVKAMLLIEPSVPYQVEKMAAASVSYRDDMAGLTNAVSACAKGIIAGTIKPDTPQSRACVDPASKSLPSSINAAHRAQQLTSGYQRTAASELENLERSGREVSASQHAYGAMPLIVMTAGKSNFNPDLAPAEQAKLDNVWWELHGEIAKLSSRGQHRLVAGASHFLPKDDPDAVISAVYELVDEVK